MSDSKKTVDDLIRSLNMEQKKPALSNHSRIRCMAGPGTGKTKVLQARVSNLLVNNQVDPERILALSFTNESSKETASRILDACGYVGAKVKTGTFHAVANKFERRYCTIDFFKDKLGYKNGFFIIDDDDSKRLLDDAKKSLPSQMSEALKELGMDNRYITSRLSKLRSQCYNATLYAKKLKRNLPQSDIDKWLNFEREIATIDPKDVKDFATQTAKSFPKIYDFLLVKTWYSYSEHCRSVNGIDFDDVLLNFYFLLRHEPSIAAKIGKQFDHLLIDEYQDTSLIQARIIQLLLKSNPSLNLFIVGDSRQSIYNFRGADVALMTHAEDMFGEFETHELIQNYRSSPQLIRFNNLFAPNMHDQITPGILKSGRPDSFDNSNEIPVDCYQFKTDRDEANWVIQESRRLIQSGVKSEEIYVLYRNRSAVRPLERELVRNNIQFEMVGEKNFYERLEVRDAVAFFRSLVRPRDVLAWARLCNSTSIGVRGVYLREKYLETGNLPTDILKSRINKKNRERIESFLNFNSLAKEALQLTESQWKTIFHEECHPDLNLNDVIYHIDNHSRAKDEYQNWKAAKLVDSLGHIMEIYTDFVYESYKATDERMCRLSDDKDPQEITNMRVENIVSVFSEVLTRLESNEELISIVDDIITRDSPKREEAGSNIKLMTGHASKGLESPYVFLIGCDSAIWGNPDKMDILTRAEEDRIYYVMATRAEKKMYYTMSESRLINGEVLSSNPYPPILAHIKKAQVNNLANLNQIKESTKKINTPTEQSSSYSAMSRNNSSIINRISELKRESSKRQDNAHASMEISSSDCIIIDDIINNAVVLK